QLKLTAQDSRPHGPRQHLARVNPGPKKFVTGTAFGTKSAVNKRAKFPRLLRQQGRNRVGRLRSARNHQAKKHARSNNSALDRDTRLPFFSMSEARLRRGPQLQRA